jgi:hypothetical protein
MAARLQPIGPAEKLVVDFDVSAFGAIYRAAIGFFTIPVLSYAAGADRADAALVPFLLATLLMLRVVPALLRKLLPFSDMTQQTWAARRQLGKRYDSFQWRKLLWVGLGLALYTVLSGEATTLRVAVSLVFILSGALGLARWRFMMGPRHFAVRQANR